ncbi:LptA/OstA family protein, partial [bacterium]
MKNCTRAIAVILLTVVTAGLPAAALAQKRSVEANGRGKIIVEAADYLRHDKENKLTILKGNVFIKYIEEDPYSETHIRAQQVVIDEKTKSATAKDNVSVSDGDMAISGETLYYKFKEKYFEMTPASGSTEAGETQGSRMYFEGERAQGTQRKIKIFHSRFSTCGPHCPNEYNMTASNISIYPKKKVIARKVGVYLRHTRVMFLPVYIASLKEDDNYRPEFGYNDDDGFYMRNRYPYITDDSPDEEDSPGEKSSPGGPEKIPTIGKNRASKAWLILNYIQKRGNDYGTENSYYSGRAGGPGLFKFLTNNKKDSGNSNQQLIINQDFTEGTKLRGGILKGDFKYNRNNTYNRNIVGSRTNTNKIDVGMNYNQDPGKTIRTLYSHRANKGRAESESTTLDITRTTRVQPKFRLTRLIR